MPGDPGVGRGLQGHLVGGLRVHEQVEGQRRLGRDLEGLGGQCRRRGVLGAAEPCGAAVTGLHAQRERQTLRGCPSGGVVAAPAAARVNAVGQHDRERVRHVVDDDRRAGVSRVTRGRRAGQPTHVPALVQLEPQTVGAAGKRGVVVGRHLLDALRRQDSVAGVGAPVEQALGEHRHVRGGREDTGVTGDATERPRVLVVDLTPDHPTGRARLELGRGDPRLQRGVRVVAGVLHPQRFCDPLADELVEPLSGLPLEKDAEGDQVEVAVDIGRPGR